MNKKAYIKPCTEELLIESQQMMAASSEPGIATIDAGDTDALSQGRRGSWGDLWE